MSLPLTRARAMGLALFLALALFLTLIRLIPLSPGAIPRPGPELSLCLAIAWILRRPDQIPALAVAGIFLLEDILLMRPPGLWALLVLLASEQLRHRWVRWRDQAFVFEWLRASGLIVLLIVAYRVIMAMFLLPVPSMTGLALQIIATIAAYPAVVLFARLVLRLRPVSQAELERAG
ncbi:MAG: rod shape-determining protein MreD [Paracoccus sp. (in: a-proteobacteria)]|nr:rod shape-determining protein MreD [Paracoccus sp. (in: a-proteobacteria)]